MTTYKTYNYMDMTVEQYIKYMDVITQENITTNDNIGNVSS